MTGHGSAVGALDATAFGAYDYLRKPFAVEALQVVIAGGAGALGASGVFMRRSSCCV